MLKSCVIGVSFAVGFSAIMIAIIIVTAPDSSWFMSDLSALMVTHSAAVLSFLGTMLLACALCKATD